MIYNTPVTGKDLFLSSEELKAELYRVGFGSVSQSFTLKEKDVSVCVCVIHLMSFDNQSASAVTLILTIICLQTGLNPEGLN